MEGVCRSDLHTKADRWERTREKLKVYVNFIDLEKAYGRVNREALCQVLKMYDVGGKLLGGTESKYVHSLY